MDADTLVRFTTQAMFLCLKVSLAPVVTAAVVGLIVSFLQAVTSMQDQTFAHAIKFVCVSIALVVAAPFSCAAVLAFAQDMMQTAMSH